MHLENLKQEIFLFFFNILSGWALCLDGNHDRGNAPAGFSWNGLLAPTLQVWAMQDHLSLGPILWTLHLSHCHHSLVSYCNIPSKLIKFRHKLVYLSPVLSKYKSSATFSGTFTTLWLERCGRTVQCLSYWQGSSHKPNQLFNSCYKQESWWSLGQVLVSHIRKNKIEKVMYVWIREHGQHGN